MNNLDQTKSSAKKFLAGSVLVAVVVVVGRFGGVYDINRKAV